MASDLSVLRDAALGLAPEERQQLARELQLSVASDEEKMVALRAAIQEGDEALARGDYDEVSPDDLRSYLAGLGREA
ncbi:MAG: hypothetical protein LKI24_11780 [Acidipropionibacterium sp.]|jgi:small ligand-binding sensory domain FIST|nr:hypothetical protein [Acidipropionibacterium sp.]